MAKQMGTITLIGTIGNITFFKSGDGYWYEAGAE